MKNRILVTIGGREYTFVASEEDGYVQKVASYVDGKMKEIVSESHVALTDAAVLTAANIADEYFKSMETAENLRRQLKEYLEEAARTKMELSELKRELSKLQNKKQ
ncbi:cell division protein ZapA [Papillibacter cinnamivorans]|uniref:cell division protein ZapA n=1 Tax=Papillibacter cinnamivorans TaxID=100176 RepID=UPI000A0270E1|nr:cell division protein ZapA [Papillibacter cinnamivorans]